ncbi:MAG: hypothetical protein ABW068_01385 [Candidatus Thiodiazotropha sp.]
MNHDIVLIGIGEIGGIFAKGFLRAGYAVHPVGRDTDMRHLCETLPAPQLVVIAVGEKDLSGVLDDVPEVWRSRLCLLQNELLPEDWSGIPQPTVISIWFEKKPGTDAKVIMASPAYGPGAELLSVALEGIGIPVRVLQDEAELLFQLVVKNVYILTTNIAGLRTGGTVMQLWNEHRAFAESVAREVIQLQEALTGSPLDAIRLIESLVEAFHGDPEHRCMGRSAPARLQRALEHAHRLGLVLPTLESVNETSGVA